MFSNWRKDKHKSKPRPGSKQRSAPKPHPHPVDNRHRKSSGPVVSVATHPRPHPSYTNRNRLPPRSPQPVSKPRSPKQPPPTNDDDDDDDDDDDMFADMDVNDDDDDEEEAPPPRSQSKRTKSIEEIQKMTDEEALTYALQMSMNTPINGNANPSSKREFPPTSPITSNPTMTKAHPPPAQQPVDKANINWPSVPTSSSTKMDSHTPSSTSNPHSNLQSDAATAPSNVSSFGFVLDGGAVNNAEPSDLTKSSNDTAVSGSVFGFIRSDSADNNDGGSGNEGGDLSMFANMNMTVQKTEDNHSVATSHDTKDQSTAVTTPSITSMTDPSPPPAAPLAPLDQSVLSQLKRAEQHHERSRKRIWSQIKQCLEREQRIKERELSLNQELAAEKVKKEEAQSAKKIALQNMNFEEAEKTKNAIRRAMKNVQDINHRLEKCSIDIKKILSDKAAQEEGYMERNRDYKEKLDVLYEKHESTMTKKIHDEYKRVDKEIRKMKEKLKRVSREIQLDDENIQKCLKQLEEIEDLIKDDVEPFQEKLDQKQSDKTALELEIETLEKALMEKRAELESVESEMADTNAEIQKVRKRYKDRMDEIFEEQGRYQQSQDKFSLQKTEYMVALSGLEGDKVKNKEAEEDLEDELEKLKLRMTRISESFDRFEGKKERHSRWSEEEQRLLDEQVTVNKKVEKIKYEIERFEKELKQIDAKCTHHRQTVATIDSALPILHSDKTTAVNNENYLEAGKIHKNILAKTQQKESSIEKLKELNTKSEDIKGRLREQRDEEVTLKQQLEDIKMKRHQLRFDLVMDHRVTIKESLDAIDVENDVEGTVLQLELEQIEQELTFFNETYGWNIEYKERETRAVESSNATDDLLEGLGGGGVADDCDGIVSKDVVSTPGLSPNEENSAIPNGGDSANGVEEETKKERTSEEVSEELKSVRDDIERMEAEKVDVQNEINKAVANDQFDVAGQLAPKKKKLIADVEEKQNIVKRLEKELEECIERESRRQSTEQKESPVDTEPIESTTESKSEDVLSAMDNMMDPIGNNTTEPGHNGIVPSADQIECTKDDIEDITTMSDKDDEPIEEPLNTEGEDNSNEQLSPELVKGTPNEESEEDEEEDDMFGDMDVVDDDAGDTVNVD